MCTSRRRRYFLDADAVELVVAHLVRAAHGSGFAVLAYCIMPDHVHLVVEGLHETANLGGLCLAVRSRTGYHWKRVHGTTLWQEGYHERVLRADEHTPSVVRYLLENPMRAGLVDRLEDYPFWGSLVCSRDELAEYAVRS